MWQWADGRWPEAHRHGHATRLRRGGASDSERGLQPKLQRLGDEGLALLADALPPTLSHLNLSNTGCGDGGMVAIAAAMPAVVSLTVLFCAANPAVGEAGWVALGAALPRLPKLRELHLVDCTGMCDGGAATLAVALPRAVSLRDLDLTGCYIGDAGAAALAYVLGRSPRPRVKVRIRTYRPYGRRS